MTKFGKKEENPFMLLREKRGLTQREIAQALDVTDQTISNWENYRSEPKLTIGQTLKLCQILQCSLEELAEIAEQISHQVKSRRQDPNP